MTTSHKKSQKTKDKTASKPALPVLRLYNNGFAKLSPAGQRGIIEAHRAHNAAVATLPDDGKLGPSAKNKYLWVGTSLEAKVKKQAEAVYMQQQQQQPRHQQKQQQAEEEGNASTNSGSYEYVTTPDSVSEQDDDVQSIAESEAESWCTAREFSENEDSESEDESLWLK